VGQSSLLCSNGSDACQPVAQPRRREIRGATVACGRAPAQRMNLEQVPGGGRVRCLAGIPLLTLGAELAGEHNGLDQWFPPRDG